MLESWETWWDFHEAALVRLRERVDRARPRTGEPDGGRARLPEYFVVERIVPALLAELAREPGPERTSAALMALARIGPRELDHPAWKARNTVDLLRDFLDHADLSVAQNACLALGVLGSPAGGPDLAALLRDDERGRELFGRSAVSTDLRAAAAYALGVLADGAGLPDVGRYAALELSAALERDEAAIDVRVAAVVAMGLAGRAGAAPPATDIRTRLESLLGDEDEHDFVRAQAATSLGALLAGVDGEPRQVALACALEVLARERTSAAPVRQGILLALGELAGAGSAGLDQRARAMLRAAAEEGDRSARAFALLSLASVASPTTPTSSEGGSTRSASAAVVREAERYLRDLLLPDKGRSKSQTRPWIALSLGLLGRELEAQGGALADESRVALVKALDRERSAEVAPALALAAGLAGAREAGDTLLERMPRESDGSYAALALGFLGLREAIPALREELRAANHEPLRMNRAASALALLGDVELVPELLRILALCECDRACVTLAYTLGHTGDSRVVPPLLRMLEDPRASDRKRAWASYALGLAADRRSLPWITRYSTRVNYLAAPPSLYSPSGGGLLEQR